MEWLKKLLGEELYAKLPEEVIKAFGDKEYIENDPTKIIPKNVFNQKNEELKLEQTKVKEYEKQLKERKNMVTDEDLKKELAKKDSEFANILKQKDEDYKKELTTMETKSLLMSLLSDEGSQGTELLINAVNLDEVIVDNGKILNADKIIAPLKEKYSFAFVKKLDGQVPPGGDPGGGEKPTKQQLIEKYEKINPRNVAERMALRREIQDIKE